MTVAIFSIDKVKPAGKESLVQLSKLGCNPKL
jgi:hypothetical protein